MNLFRNPDGASAVARAVLAFLQNRDGLESSWNSETHQYMAEPTVARWYNCREQGYVISMQSRNQKDQINIAWFEHRNSDQVCAAMFEQKTINPPTIDSFPKDHPYYSSKYDYDVAFDYNQPREMADWIYDKLEAFWKFKF